MDGSVVFSEEVVWDPYHKPDPQYHFDGIMESLRTAASHLPRVDAIGGSAAGVYVNNRVKLSSLFRGIAPELFESRVKDLFLEIRKAPGIHAARSGERRRGHRACGVDVARCQRDPGHRARHEHRRGLCHARRQHHSWLDELAFVPIDYNPSAPVDEWSGDYGVGSQFFSQQCVGRLLPVAGIEAPSDLGLPEKLKLVQKLMAEGDYRARKIYQTLGTYLGYGVAHFADFYDCQHVLVLGRVTSGSGGDDIVNGAREVLKVEFPELASRITFHVPDEKEKRHGQAIAAASLPSSTR